MRYYAAWGHTEFVLCLGYKGDVIKEYFLTHNEALMHDFVLEGYGGETEIEILNRDGGPGGSRSPTPGPAPRSASV